ncbi:hypothetical protein M378DRAFT_163749 [Amanita muscaria Koide BX008]|uniref:Uncharacterized protein n=1 Tax=Amanita muscaria (strain Koide BX008) TaxID=946122 RepID=A0A0C2SLK7_AMAMK|nr:hypothetical protein M378DRAFT_163749 [Amanita muscaria Koide BX008]
MPRPVTDDFKTPDRVFTDFLRYLFKSAKGYITETERIVDPTFTWSSIERNTYFVLTHPNGWGRKQQSQMRDAAIAADLVNRSTVADQIAFVTEGEASLRFCVDKNPELHHERGGLLVVDCGGGTIGLSAYSQNRQGDFKEIVPPDCLLQGSLFITSRARDYFKGRFKDSKYGTDDIVEAMARAFDKPEGVKCMFRCSDRPYFVKFGGLRDNDQKYGICGGKFKVEGAQLANFFEPAVANIIAGIENQCRNTKDGVSIKHVLLVGGFGRSQYLYAKLSDHFNSRGIVVLRPDITHLNKAVADGAVSWYLDHYVSTHSYEVIAGHLLDPADPDHLDRENTQVTQATGESYIAGVFSTILEMDSEVWEEKQFRQAHEFIPISQRIVWTAVNTPGNRGQATDLNQIQIIQAPVSEEARLNHLLVEVAELVRVLNARIEQTSSLIEDSLSYREPPISSKGSEDVLNEFIDYIGPWLCNDLPSTSNGFSIEPRPLLTRIALQSGLVNACSCIINNGISPSDGATLSTIHSDMVKAGQADDHAWKARIVLKLITKVGGSLESGGVLSRQYNEVLEEIDKALISEDVTSVMEPNTYTIPYGAEFYPSRMEDAEGEESETGSSRVICIMKMTEPDPQIALQSGLVNGCSYVIHNGITPSDGAPLSQTHGDTVKACQADADAWKFYTTSTGSSVEAWATAEYELNKFRPPMKGRSSATVAEIDVEDSKPHKPTLMELGRMILSRGTYVSQISPLAIPFY